MATLNKCKKRQRSRTESESPERSGRPSKRCCTFRSSWKQQIFEVEINGILQSFSGKVLSGTEGNSLAYCSLCNAVFSVRSGGANDVSKHFGSKKHALHVSSMKHTRNLSNFGVGNSEAAKVARRKSEELQHNVQNAEAQFIQFVAEHNLPFRTGDHFSKLVKSMFPDSEIAKKFQCSRTKTPVLNRYGNAKWVHDKMISSLNNSQQPVFWWMNPMTVV